MSRLQGGTEGILSALEYGRLDPRNGTLAEDVPVPFIRGSDRRRMIRRERARRKRLEQRDPF